jgi:hypothetical protein
LLAEVAAAALIGRYLAESSIHIENTTGNPAGMHYCNKSALLHPLNTLLLTVNTIPLALARRRRRVFTAG